jgi:hypothetical protein
LGLLFAFSSLDITPIGFGLGIDTELKPNFVEITDLKNVYLQQNYEGNNILTQNFATSLTVKIDKRREYLLEYNLPSIYFGYNALACFLVSYKDLGMRSLKPIKNFAPKTYKKLTYKNNPFVIIKNNNSFALKENLAIIKGNFDKAVLILGLDEAKWIWNVRLSDFLSEYSLINNKALANKSILSVTKKQLEILGFGKKASEVLKWFKINQASVSMEYLITNISQLGDKIDGKDMPIVFCGDENCISLLLDFMGKREE